ncbi:hypothetical protein SDRG_01374 [Saprolegnia diclina VS20]|uniref:Uncharacterized protein n=1 Tax=Saprolegnia diclina (strain VS20) TaxID=1156394 RepID=T0QTA2_SAPDV|nr:hypothetical protein SDRG_01374 [Saprolegnia diclina VS20]EQC41404.1 hypothetical protein SDRG_01374 [Saprolegnia diclina VS20]|eukprot:XP_008605118.1 hypothetical protein SDRG_01374 [Saprolegnia diclina VS20]
MRSSASSVALDQLAAAVAVNLPRRRQKQRSRIRSECSAVGVRRYHNMQQSDPLAQYLSVVPDASSRKTIVLDQKPPTQRPPRPPQRPATARSSREKPPPDVAGPRERAFHNHVRRRFHAFVAGDKLQAHNLFAGWEPASAQAQTSVEHKNHEPGAKDPHWEPLHVAARVHTCNQVEDENDAAPTFSLNTNPSVPLVNFRPRPKAPPIAAPEQPNVVRLAQQLDHALDPNNELPPTEGVPLTMKSTSVLPKASGLRRAMHIKASASRPALKKTKPRTQYIAEHAHAMLRVQDDVRSRVRAHMLQLQTRQEEARREKRASPVCLERVVADMALWRMHGRRFESPALIDDPPLESIFPSLTIAIECSVTTKDEGPIAFSLPRSRASRADLDEPSPMALS